MFNCKQVAAGLAACSKTTCRGIDDSGVRGCGPESCAHREDCPVFRKAANEAGACSCTTPCLVCKCAQGNE